MERFLPRRTLTSTSRSFLTALLLLLLLSVALVVTATATVADDDVMSGSSVDFGYGSLDPGIAGGELEEEEEEEDGEGEDGEDNSLNHSGCSHSHQYSDHVGENASHTCPVQDMKSYRLESVKRDILRKLNMETPPNISVGSVPQVPRLQALIDRIGKDHNGYDDEPKSTFILFGKAAEDETAADDECVFHLKSDLFAKRLEKASLGLYVRKPRRYEAKWTGWLLVSFDGRLVLKKRLTMVANETSRWYTFNVTGTARDWFLRRKREVHMNVVGSDSTGTPLPVVRPLHDGEEHYKPYLFLKLKEQISSRLKRTLNDDCVEGDRESRCCRYPLVINFADMGWNWIIVPPSYNAYYCAGDCPPGRSGSPYLHLKESMGAAKCCASRKLSSISIIYFDESRNIVLSRVPNMVVEQCECV